MKTFLWNCAEDYSTPKQLINMRFPEHGDLANRFLENLKEGFKEEEDGKEEGSHRKYKIFTFTIDK